MNPIPRRENSGTNALLGIAALLAVGFAVFEHSEAKREKNALLVSTRERLVDESELQRLAKRLKIGEERQAELEKRLRRQGITAEDIKAALDAEAATPAFGQQSTKTGANSPESNGNAKAKPLSDGQAFLSAFSQSHDLLIGIAKAQIARNFSVLIKSRAITPEQADELETQTAEHWAQTIAVKPSTIYPSDLNLSDDQLRSILGEQGLQQLYSSLRVQPMQGVVNDISSLSTSAPLDQDQRTQLMTILANASSAYGSGGRATVASVDWNQALTQAQGILTEPQMNALRAESQLGQLMGLVKQFYQNPPPPK